MRLLTTVICYSVVAFLGSSFSIYSFQNKTKDMNGIDTKHMVTPIECEYDSFLVNNHTDTVRHDIAFSTIGGRERIVVSDSLFTIMIHAHRIICSLESLNPRDTTRIHSKNKVPNKIKEVLLFTFQDSTNFQTNDTVYGLFCPDVSFMFSKSLKKRLTLQLDFGLKKWRLLNSNNDIICTADMKNSAYYYILLTRKLFPDDITLRLLYDSLKP